MTALEIPWRNGAGESGVYVVSVEAALRLVSVALLAQTGPGSDHTGLTRDCGTGMCYLCYLESTANDAMALVETKPLKEQP